MQTVQNILMIVRLKDKHIYDIHLIGEKCTKKDIAQCLKLNYVFPFLRNSPTGPATQRQAQTYIRTKTR